jgi:glycosyltransferase involved in cell wall biosynthesis
MQESLISIIIACYNQGEYLSEAIDSILNQTISNWECIVVNDGSTDNTEEVALNYCSIDPRLKYVNKRNGGLSSARNFGIYRSSGAFIVCLDADDKLAPTYLEACLKEFFENPNTKVVYTEARKFDFEDIKWDIKPYTYDRLLSTNMIFCSAMFKKEDWLRVGGYDELVVNGLEDWEFWLRILDSDSIVKRIPQELFFYRVKEFSMFKKMQTHDIDFVSWRALEKNFDVYKKKFPSPQRLYMELEFTNERKMHPQSKIYTFTQNLFNKIKNLLYK